jgi:hypothetical protein
MDPSFIAESEKSGFIKNLAMAHGIERNELQ